MTESRETAEPRRLAWVVDDSTLESEMARRALAPDYDVELFSDGSAVLEQLASRPPPDVLVLDWVMPGLSGIEICHFLRARPSTLELPVLLLTINQQIEQIVEGLAAGANDYLSKPYAATELRARVAALIRSAVLRERVERAERLLRQVLSQLPDAVLTVDGRGTILFANEEASRLLGANLVGRELAATLPQLTLGRLIETGQGPAATLPDLKIAARILAPRVSIPPRDDLGNTTITLRDVTDLRLKEERRLDFYSMVAHDLRSPLNALLMRGQMMLQGMRGALSADVRVELEKMNGRVRELVLMVSDFLDIAQMETAHFALVREAVEMAEICARVYEEYRSLADARALELSLHARDVALVEGDSRRLTQVVSNLVSNALKFTSEGGRVSIHLGGDKQEVEVSVEDTGRGIAAEAQQRLFTKYERVGGSTTAKVEGTGLGLVIVKEIVEAHGGTIGLTSSPGSGSRFWFRLPRRPEGP